MSQNARETWYGSTRFRSALESDWAATLHSLGIEWQYEPKLIDLPSGQLYLPDFWLPEIGTWIEVKGDGIPRSEKAYELAEMVRCHHRDRAECTCKWFGGQIVLIGHPAARGNDLRHGAIRWDDARYSAVLARCGHCDNWCWLRPRISLRCRRCEVLDPVRLQMHGTDELQFHHSDRLSTAEAMDTGGAWAR
ncbi:MAG: hypothetical protein M3Y33_06190 [Actinomycetota bacterium]|nr:hypothetical protein [Actinomycetota bacterium]